MRTTLLHLDDLSADLHFPISRTGDRRACREKSPRSAAMAPRSVKFCSWAISNPLWTVERSPWSWPNSASGVENFPRGVEISPSRRSDSLRGVSMSARGRFETLPALERSPRAVTSSPGGAAAFPPAVRMSTGRSSTSLAAARNRFSFFTSSYRCPVRPHGFGGARRTGSRPAPACSAVPYTPTAASRKEMSPWRSTRRKPPAGSRC